jgi:hypothetical protein
MRLTANTSITSRRSTKTPARQNNIIIIAFLACVIQCTYQDRKYQDTCFQIPFILYHSYKLKSSPMLGKESLGLLRFFGPRLGLSASASPLNQRRPSEGFLPLYKTHKRIACSLDLSACYQTATETYGDLFVPSCVEEDHDEEEEKVRHIHTRSLLAYSS